MKKKRIILTGLITTASLLMFSSCGDGSAGEATKPVKDIASDVLNCGVDFPEMVEVSEENFQVKYNLSAEDYEEFSLWWAGSGADADEVCIIKAKDKGKVREAVSDRLKGQKNTFKDYVPKQYDKLCKSDVQTKGNYVYWLCTNDNDKSEKALEDDFE